MKSLRSQLLLSHLVLVAVMCVALVGAVLSFIHLGGSINRILKDNYASVIAAQNMKETLERQDSAATFFLAGQTAAAQRQYNENWPLFEKAYLVEAHNITEPGEQQLADDIGRQFGTYRKRIERLLYASPPMPADAARSYYFGTLEPAFLRLKQRAQDVLDINQKAIVRSAGRAKAEARTASLMGIIVTTAAVILSTVLSSRMIGATLAPIRSLERQADEIGRGHLNQRIDLHRTDEIGGLAESFNLMTEKLREARRVEEERLHRAERMSDAALQSLYDPVIVTDAVGSIVHINRAAEALFGPAHRAASKPASATIHNPHIIKAIERALRLDQSTADEEDGEVVRLQAGVSERVFRVRVTPMRDADLSVLGAALVLEDITHLKELDRLKTEFIGVASHELRTPVTSLLLSVQLLDEGAAGPITDEHRAIISAQKDDLLRLDRLMRDLLDITRLEMGVTVPHPSPSDPASLVQTAAETVRSSVEAGGLTLAIDVSSRLPAVDADPPQIIRVLVNLVNNAVRHTPKGGTVQIAGRNVGGEVTFCVSDTGSGIPPEYLPRIFDRFVQVPGATRGGAGLGLSIVQTIVRAHGGRVWVESEVDRGSTFCFTLPEARKE